MFSLLLTSLTTVFLFLYVGPPWGRSGDLTTKPIKKMRNLACQRREDAIVCKLYIQANLSYITKIKIKKMSSPLVLCIASSYQFFKCYCTCLICN